MGKLEEFFSSHTMVLDFVDDVDDFFMNFFDDFVWVFSGFNEI